MMGELKKAQIRYCASISGPFAAKGNFIAPNYVVNANHGQDCSATGSVKSYGLVVGGQSFSNNVQVHDSAFIGSGT